MPTILKKLFDTELKRLMLIPFVFSLPMLFAEYMVYSKTPPHFNNLETIEGTISVEPRNRIGWVLVVNNGFQEKRLTCSGALENSNCNLNGALDKHINKIVKIYYHDGTVYQVEMNGKIIISYREYISHYQYTKNRYPYIFTLFYGLALIFFIYLQIFKDPLFFLADPLKKYEYKE